MRNRFPASLAIALATIAGTFAMAVPTRAAEAPKDKACPAEPSGFVEASLPPLGSALPNAGEDFTWDLRVAGLAAEGLTVEQGAELLGFSSVQELYDFSLAQLHRDDHDGNGQICVNLKNSSPGLPAYAFLRVDDRAATHDGK